jgi:hypothetical protein
VPTLSVVIGLLLNVAAGLRFRLAFTVCVGINGLLVSADTWEMIEAFDSSVVGADFASLDSCMFPREDEA